jgi:hypothetical protein
MLWAYQYQTCLDLLYCGITFDSTPSQLVVVHLTNLPQGDLLCWLVSAALAQDSSHNHAALARARARDELLVATMELRERAMALHLHIPHKFTLNTKRERVDVRAGWAETISKVEQVCACVDLYTLTPRIAHPTTHRW